MEQRSLAGNHLTPTEMGKLWASYVGNTMGEVVLKYYLKHTDDKEVHKILEFALDLSETFVKDIKAIFKKDQFPIPEGFTEKDVNSDAPRLFHDEFYLYYLQYLGKGGMSIYSVAIPLVTREDVRDFFIRCLQGTTKLMSDVNQVMNKKGLLMNPPPMPAPKKIDHVTRQDFLSGYFGDVRPLTGLEVAHLYGNINNDVTSKALIIGFSQVAQRETIRKYLIRGKNINQKHIEKMTDKLQKSNVPAPSLLDHLVTTSTTPTFSDKLIMFHKIDMFSMKMREYANGASLTGRHDIGALYAKCFLDVSLYVEDGANIMIDYGWMEQPPLVVDRNDLSEKKTTDLQ
ncbi:MAG: DUF3231 family protein [Tuberibacillus sp.]